MTITNKVSNKSVMPGVTPVADVVDAPTIGTATDSGDGTTASVPFTASATGGTATSFTAVSTPSSITGSSATSPITVTGLADSTAYTFKVYGANSSGTWSAVQSSASNSLTLAVPTSFDSISTVTVGSGGTSTITFSSIPQTYSHLQLRILARTTVTNDSDFCGIRFNSDSTSVYNEHGLYGTGSSASAMYNASSYCIVQRIATNQFSSNIFGVIVLDILDYKDTNKYKVTKHLGGFDSNGDGQLYLESNLWRSTSAINTITIVTSGGTNFVQYSHFALYGIKA